MSRVALILNQKRVSENVTTVLNVEGHEVVDAENESSAKSMISRENPDIAIVDSFNGDALLKDIRNAFPDLPIICWMQERNAHMAVELMHSGAIDCLCPPLRAAEVIGVLNHALGHSGGIKKGTRLLLPYYSIMKYKKIVYGVLGFLFLLFILRLYSISSRVKSYNLPHKNPTGIAWDGKNIWISDWYTQSIYKYSVGGSLKLSGNYYFSGFGPMALALSEKYLWSAGNDLELRQHIRNDRLEIVKTYHIKEHSPSGIVVVGDYLWLSDSTKNKIYQYLLSDKLSYINEFDCPLSYAVGLSWDGVYLWLADAKTNKLYKYRITDMGLEIKDIYELPPNPGAELAGICTAKKWIYLVYTGNPGRLFRYKLGSLKKIKQGK
ncbi:MAG: response regulator [Endomicrobiales bacterium]|nr:response regulator [Endomicrobiales bacterium]